MSIGACLVANEPTDIGKAMIKRRAEGASWKEIADEFDLPNPGAARKAFTKHTGITDYKTKGPDIYSVKPGSVAKAQTDNVVEAAAKDANEVLKPNTAANAPAPPQPMSTSSLSTKHDDIIEAFEQGKGYTAIQSQTGASFQEIDQSVWNHLLKKEMDKATSKQEQLEAVWKAYKKKPTSQGGYDAVMRQVNELKLAGHNTTDIAFITDIPKAVVQAIENNTWSMPPMGATQPLIPGVNAPAPPKPPSTYSYNGPLPDVVGRNYNYTTDGEMMQWLNGLGQDLEQRHVYAIQRYTGSGYVDINGAARNGRTNQYFRDLDEAMRPAPKDLHLVRQTSYESVFPGKDPQDLVGTVFHDKGYTSTTIQPSGVWSGNMRLEIHAPAGTMGRYVRNISSHKGEYEYLLARETPMMIMKVEVESHGYSNKYVIHVQILV